MLTHYLLQILTKCITIVKTKNSQVAKKLEKFDIKCSCNKTYEFEQGQKIFGPSNTLCHYGKLFNFLGNVLKHLNTLPSLDKSTFSEIEKENKRTLFETFAGIRHFH